MIPLDGLFAVGVQLDMATCLFLAIFGELYHPEISHRIHGTGMLTF